RGGLAASLCPQAWYALAPSWSERFPGLAIEQLTRFAMPLRDSARSFSMRPNMGGVRLGMDCFLGQLPGDLARTKEKANVQNMHHLRDTAAINRDLCACTGEHHDIWSSLCCSNS